MSELFKGLEFIFFDEIFKVNFYFWFVEFWEVCFVYRGSEINDVIVIICVEV